MNNAVVKPMYGIEDYLRAEAQAEFRHEYVAGGVFAMAGGSERHNRIAGNVYVRLRSQIRGTGCRVFISDMKLRIDASRSVYYPDVMLSCDEGDTHPLYKTSPCLVVEVLSPSTATTDRREKRLAYLALPSVQAYLLVDADSRRVEHVQRHEQGFVDGLLVEHEQLVLPCGVHTLSLSLDDIYEDVEGLAA
jgi:Uma2 family endonuclease